MRFPSKSILKLDNRKNFYARHTLRRHKKNISNSVKASQQFLHQCLTNKLAKFYQNPTNLHVKRGNSRKKEASHKLDHISPLTDHLNNIRLDELHFTVKKPLVPIRFELVALYFTEASHKLDHLTLPIYICVTGNLQIKNYFC